MSTTILTQIAYFAGLAFISSENWLSSLRIRLVVLKPICPKSTENRFVVSSQFLVLRKAGFDLN